MIASNSKTFAAVSLFQARDLGLLPQGLDTAVKDLLPSFAILPPNSVAAAGQASPLRSKRPITLRALAMQVSGLPREPPYPDNIPANATLNEVELLVLKSLAGLTQISQQFTEPHYSNLGLALVGRAVGHAAGKPWEQHLMDAVLRPLGMNDTGNPSDYLNGVGARANLVDGVDPGTSLTQPVPVAMADHWSGPAGSMHSSMRDMVTWMNFLMDVGTPEERAVYATVLDPATRAEMRSSGFLMGDGLSAIGAGVFETTFTHGRWASNKLGCVSGYRSAMSMVPSLGLAVFGVATSTCDLRGDGDAIAFPVTASLVPAVARVLADAEAKAQAASLPPQGSVLAAIEGRYCSTDLLNAMTVGVEQVPLPSAANSTGGTGSTAAALVLRPAASHHDYSYVLEYVGDSFAAARYGKGATQWRRIMGPEQYLPPSFPGCTPDTATNRSGGGGAAAGGAGGAGGAGKGLCSISCSRKMSRGSGESVFFYTETQGAQKGVMRMENPGAGDYCHRVTKIAAERKQK